MLPSLRPGDWRAVICVRVCRKWLYRGGTDYGPIQHVDLVLLDEQGNSLYAEIPGPEVEAKSHLVNEGGLYVIGRFRVSNAKSAYRAVDAPYMVEFTLHTTVSAPRTDMPNFPSYAYKITPIDELPAHAGDTKNFLDTIGTLVEVSTIQTVHLPNKPPTLSRHIILRDQSYSEMKITLWGERATAFTTEGVYSSSEAKPIVVLVVGGLMKSFRGSYYLSGNAACRWYFNPAIPEARPFYESLLNQRLEIRSVTTPVQQQPQIRVPAQLLEKNLKQLNEMDPYEFSESGYRCTVTIGSLLPNASWWFPSCTRCSKSCAPDGAGYRCIPCSNTSFKYKYKICFIAVDDTDEGEMVCFGDIARCMIGKPVQQLLRTSASANGYPADITKLVNLRFTFAVTMTRQGFYKARKTYSVASLVTSHGQAIAIPHNAGHGESGESSNTSSGGGAHALPAATTGDTTPTSGALLNTPPPSVATLQPSMTKKHQRGESSTSSKHPSCRRRLIQDLSDNEVAAADILGPSDAADKAQTGEHDGSSEEHSSAQKSG